MWFTTLLWKYMLFRCRETSSFRSARLNSVGGCKGHLRMGMRMMGPSQFMDLKLSGNFCHESPLFQLHFQGIHINYHASQKQQTETWFPKDHPWMNRLTYELNLMPSKFTDMSMSYWELLFPRTFFCCESHPNSLEITVKTELVTQVQESVQYSN